MTSLSFLSIPEDDDVLAEKITLLAGQLNSGDYCLLKFIAEYGTASHVEKVVSKYRRVQRSDDEVHENEQDNARKLVYFQQEDGMWVIHATLPPEAGSLVVKAIEAVATPVQLEKQAQLKQEKQEEQEKAEAVKDVSAETTQEALRALAPDVDVRTCVSKWRGEDCDYGMTIDALLERDSV